MHAYLLTPQFRTIAERWVIGGAIASFFIHLGLIFALRIWDLGLADQAGLLTDPIHAIYTPFSFILLYEVYLLIYYLPKSVANYIGKQYEIIALISIRKIFKDLSDFHPTVEAMQSPANVQLAIDLVTAMLLYLLIWVYYLQNKRKRGWIKPDPDERASDAVRRFVRQKQWLAKSLIPVLVVLAVYSLIVWIGEHQRAPGTMITEFADVNAVFFDEFFTLMILTDVLLLLLSLYQSDEFSIVMRNAGFIISTVLIRFSFTAEGWVNDVLVVGAVLVGVVMSWGYNRYLTLEAN